MTALLAALAGNIYSAPFGTLSHCPVLWDGRLPQAFTASDIGTSAIGPYYPSSNIGMNRSYTDYIQFPDVPQSKFDAYTGTKAFETTIDDLSIFLSPLSTVPQYTYRRTDLCSNTDFIGYTIPYVTNITTEGSKTVHFSIRPDPERPLNYSHSYQIMWQEYASFQTIAGAWEFTLGAPLNSSTTGPDKALRLWDKGGGNQTTPLWEMPFEDGVWQNIGVSNNYANNSIQVWYSLGNATLEPVTGWLPNNFSTIHGVFHFGIFKKPTGTFQETNLNEGLIYGGIFEEDNDIVGCQRWT